MTIISSRILLHVCCAPCSGAVIDRLLDEGWQPTVFFFNPNVHPREEYERRKADVAAYAGRLELALIDGDYAPDAWFQRVRGLENEPERGERCRRCFEMRLEAAAARAVQEGFSVFATTNGFSRWKDLAQVNAAGLRAAAMFPELRFWDRDWRKGGAEQTAARISRDENFYRQRSCGCVYSLRPPGNRNS